MLCYANESRIVNVPEITYDIGASRRALECCKKSATCRRPLVSKSSWHSSGGSAVRAPWQSRTECRHSQNLRRRCLVCVHGDTITESLSESGM